MCGRPARDVGMKEPRTSRPAPACRAHSYDRAVGRGSPRAREAPPIPAGERLRRRGRRAPLARFDPLAVRRRLGAVPAGSRSRAQARRTRVARQRSVGARARRNRGAGRGWRPFPRSAPERGAVVYRGPDTTSGSGGCTFSRCSRPAWLHRCRRGRRATRVSRARRRVAWARVPSGARSRAPGASGARVSLVRCRHRSRDGSRRAERRG